MNNASDFQPPTRNPQNDVGGSLQNNDSTLQPNGSDSSVNQQALPQTNNLKVQTQTAQPSGNKTADNLLKNTTSIGVFVVAVVIVVMILLAVAKTAKPPKTDSAAVAPKKSGKDRKGNVLKDKVVASSASKSKKTKKKNKSKKRR